MTTTAYSAEMHPLTADERLSFRVSTWALLVATALAGSAVLVSVVAVGYQQYVYVDAWLAHPFLLSTVAGCLLALTMHRVVRFQRVRLLLVTLVLALVGLVAAAGSFLALLNGGFDSTQTAAPQGRPYSIVVKEGAAMIDQLWYVSVRTQQGLRSRTWHVACFNSDEPQNDLDVADWASPDLLRLRTTGGDVTLVTVDPHTGRPQVPAGIGTY